MIWDGVFVVPHSGSEWVGQLLVWGLWLCIIAIVYWMFRIGRLNTKLDHLARIRKIEEAEQARQRKIEEAEARWPEYVISEEP